MTGDSPARSGGNGVDGSALGQAPESAATVKVDVLSDPICPWCYIGKANLDAALAESGGSPFEIEWHPFQLNPDMPEGGIDRRVYLERKFGGKEGAARAYMPVVEHAEAAGLEINLERIRVTPSTLDAHRLIHWAGIERCQNAVVDALFRAYFVQGLDIGNREVLAGLAGTCGMDAAVAGRLLEGDADLDDVRQRDADARQRGVTAVPTFIVANSHAVAGAQPPDLWTRVIREISGSSGGSPGASNGSAAPSDLIPPGHR